MLVTDTSLRPPPTKRQFLRGTLAMVEAGRHLPRGAVSDVLSGSHLLHRPAGRRAHPNFPRATYTREEACPTTIRTQAINRHPLRRAEVAPTVLHRQTRYVNSIDSGDTMTSTPEQDLTHVRADGSAHMVDVTEKSVNHPHRGG